MTSASNIPIWLMALKEALIRHNVYERRVVDCCAGDTSMVYYLMEHFEIIGSADFTFEIEPICVTDERWRLLATTACGVVTRPPTNQALIKTMVESAFSRREVKFCAALVQYPYNSLLMTQDPSIIIDIAGIDESFLVWINQSINASQCQQPKLYSLSKRLAEERFNDSSVIELRVRAHIRGTKRLTSREKDLLPSGVPGGTITAKNYTSQFPKLVLCHEGKLNITFAGSRPKQN